MFKSFLLFIFKPIIRFYELPESTFSEDEDDQGDQEGDEE